MRFTILPLALSLLATQVLADGASILAAMTSISNATIALNNTLNSFHSAPLLGIGDVLPLLINSITLLTEINKGTAVASQSANLTALESIGVAQATMSLSTVVSTTMANLVNTKPEFDKLLIVSPLVLLNLKEEKDATDKFGTAVVSKVPAGLQGVAAGLLAPIDQAFNTTIVAFS